MAGDELARSPRHVRLMAEYYCEDIPSHLLGTSQVSNWSNSSDDDDDDDDEVDVLTPGKTWQDSDNYIFESPRSSWPQRILSPELSNEGDFGYDFNESDNSEGLDTPETYAMEPEVEVPDFSLAMAPAVPYFSHVDLGKPKAALDCLRSSPCIAATCL